MQGHPLHEQILVVEWMTSFPRIHSGEMGVLMIYEVGKRGKTRLALRVVHHIRSNHDYLHADVPITFSFQIYSTQHF